MCCLFNVKYSRILNIIWSVDSRIGSFKKTPPGGRELPKMVTKSDKGRYERRTPLSNFAEHLLIFLQSISLYFCKHLSIFLQTTYSHFCRTTFSIFAENISAVCRKPLNISNRTPRSTFLWSSLSIFPVIIIQSSILNNSHQQFCRTPLSLFAKSLSLFLQKISQKNFVRDSNFKVDTASDVWLMSWSTNYAFFFNLNVRKRKSDTGYCVINIHDIELRIHFPGWFIWKYFPR